VLRYHFPLNLRTSTPTLVCSPKLSPNTNKIDPSNRIGRKLSLPPLTLLTISPKCKGINNLGASRTLPPLTTTSSRPRRSTHSIKRYKIPHHVSIRTTMVADKDSQTPTITPTLCPHLTLTISPSPNKCNTHPKTSTQTQVNSSLLIPSLLHLLFLQASHLFLRDKASHLFKKALPLTLLLPPSLPGKNLKDNQVRLDSK